MRWPDSALEQDALFMAGESYFFADRLTKANDFYERLVKKHPNSRHLDTLEARRFAIAQYWLELHKTRPRPAVQMNVADKTRPMFDTFGNAVRVFDKIRLEDPTGKLADDATMAAGNAHFMAGNYMDAAEFYDDLRRTFPSSEHQFKAHFLGLKAKLLSYQGPHYDGAPLDDAEKLIGQIRKQFKAEAQQEEEFLKLAYAEVRFKKAEREWKMASYYDNRFEFGGARHYYNIILADYADVTDLAERAKKRLEEIKDRPDVPPQVAPWVANVFPANYRRDPLKPRPGPNMLQRIFQPAPPKRPPEPPAEEENG
jgi:outer membrane protein assembly factor BamD (BamD/ComL family)